MLSASDSNIKIITNKLEQKGINVSKIIEPVLGLNPADRKVNKDILDRARQELSSAIIDSPQLKGKDELGANIEGIVVNMPSGRLVKVTSQKMKDAMSAKNAAPSQTFGDTKTRTAVVAIGNFAGHRGHEQLINFAIDKAQELNGTPFVFVGHKVGPDDPIDINTKLETLRKLFPGVSVSVVQNQIDASGQETQGNIFKKIEYELVKKEPFYNNIVVTVGSDQAGLTKTTDQMQARYSKFAPLAHVKVSTYVTPRKDTEGGTGVSTTQLRNAIKTMPEDQAFQVWSKAYNVQKLGADWIKHLMDIARKNMGIANKPQPQAPQPVAERLFNALVRPVNENINAKVAAIAKANNIANVNLIKPGQQLKMPDGSTYTVKLGDTLSGIAAGKTSTAPTPTGGIRQGPNPNISPDTRARAAAAVGTTTPKPQQPKPQTTGGVATKEPGFME
ncbi:MAG: LysM peptidoglycan-binding domain-containing protein, partial [Synechococcaceae bacterium WB8_1B_057]|nr:LysM peptidoglycan-binding domain-containing protein [Synechococcaceae bacterium WB8_1B_057]